MSASPEMVDKMLEKSLETDSHGKEKRRKRHHSKEKVDADHSSRRSKSKSRKSKSPKSKKRSRSSRRSRSRSGSRHKRKTRSRSKDPDDKYYRPGRTPPPIVYSSPPVRRRSRERDFYAARPLPPPRSRLPGPERRDVMPFNAKEPPPHGANMRMTPEERDARTVCVMQISQRIRPRDLEEFFSSVGRVRDVRVITDSRTGRSKGIAYVEFWEIEAVALAIGLNSQKLYNCPLMIQPTMAERNRATTGQVGDPAFSQEPEERRGPGPIKLYVGSLHTNIDETMLRSIFEPFGEIVMVQLIRNPGPKAGEAGSSRGYGFVTYRHAEDGKRAMQQMNGFDLAGRPMKVGFAVSSLPIVAASEAAAAEGGSEGMDKVSGDNAAGVDLGSTGRLELMRKLAQGTGLALPTAAQQILSLQQQETMQQTTPAIATQCFVLSNMFDPTQESGDAWALDIEDDVLEECAKHGGVLHIYVDRQSDQGNVYVKCPNVTAAVAAVAGLHGRWFAGKVITANYVPVNRYHELFPEAMKAVRPLDPGFRSTQPTGVQSVNDLY